MPSKFKKNFRKPTCHITKDTRTTKISNLTNGSPIFGRKMSDEISEAEVFKSAA